MARGTLTIVERRSRVEAAREALAGLGEVLGQASGAELGELMGVVDDVAAQACAARVAVTVEAARRGECTGAGVHGWVREHAPSLRQGGAGPVAALVREVTAADTGLARVEPDPGSPVGLVWAAVTTGTVAAGTATAVLREVDRLAPLLRPEAVPTVTAALVDLATEWGPTVMRRLRPRLLADHGRHGVLDDLHHRLEGAARLSMPHVESADLTEYQLWMTPEQATALEAAIGPLSAPAPNPETGERDLRPAGQRRVEALTEVCRRSSTRDADQAGADGAAGSPAAVHVTITLTDLEHRTGAAEVLGSAATATLLPPEALRRIACDAALVPHVLGTHGEHLDQGRVARLFTRAQRRRLWLRDRGCTYPGCTAPAAWTRAHHLTHWADGGPSDITNAALLCQHHHTTVHRRRLAAHTTPTPDPHGRHVHWDLTDGSYDRHLAHQRKRAPGDPPPRPPTPLHHAHIGAPDHHDDLELWWAELTDDDWTLPAA
ncbi:HNH endonuclease signature motif containing protein [uncultured Phycicoccus sp.]|uniref:HNH endonuclease signature motif containing protein n=1 Tax=uncultured Phycicoccus sp. TaxID=661422 RepID=UPI0026291DFD|nr:HNH endonuclease signature motif containing protein [uncultured Phycicoccus sp.]